MLTEEMKRENQNYVKNLRSVGRVKPEIIDLIEKDLKAGVKKEQVEQYKTMKLEDVLCLSKCFQRGYSEEEIAIFIKPTFTAAQSEVLLAFYEKGVALACLKEVSETEQSAHQMKRTLEAMKEQMNQTISVGIELEDEQVVELLAKVEGVVTTLAEQGNRYDTLNQLIEHLKQQQKEEDTKGQLSDKIKELEDLLEEHQEKMNEVRASLRRSKEEGEQKEKQIQNLEQQIENLMRETEQSYMNETTKPKMVSKKKVEQVEEKKAPMEKEETIQPTYLVPLVNEAGEVVQRVPIDYVKQPKKQKVGAWISSLCTRFSGKKDIVDLVIGGELSPEQLQQIRIGMEHHLKDDQLIGLIENKVSTERMSKIIEIAMLLNSREG